MPPPEKQKFMETRTFNLEQQLIARLRDGMIENDEEADLLTKRRQALWTERSRMKDKESAQAQEALAKIEETLKLINTRLRQWKNRGG